MGWCIASGPDVGHWVAKRINGGFFEERSIALGLKKGDELVAGVIYENWNHQSIWCHIAIEGRMTPTFLAAIFDYPYNVAQAEKIIAPIGSDNEEMTTLIKHMGFTEEGRIKDGRPHGDIVFFTLLRDDCRFLGKRFNERIHYGQRLSLAATGA